MTEAEWNACIDPEPMLEFMGGKVSDRKLRLFAVACCRHIWDLLTDERSRKAVEVAELFADSDIEDDKMSATSTAAWAVSSFSLGRPAAAADAAAEATWGDDGFGGRYHASLVTYNVFYAVGEIASESIAQCNLIRDISGNPFSRSTPIPPAFHGTTVTQLAAAIYEEKAFDRMPILGDALEDAGCTDSDMLNHCRQPGEHVRGCWVIDLLTGRK